MKSWSKGQRIPSKDPDFQKILDHVNTENNRLWRLYDNRLDGGSGRNSDPRINSTFKQKRNHKDVNPMENDDDDKELSHSESEKQVAQFMKAVKNHTIYRRDNFVRNLANQTKQSLDPYLRFQILKKPDPFKQRPLSSAIK